MAAGDDFTDPLGKIFARFDDDLSGRFAGPERMQIRTLATLIEASHDMNNLKLLWGDASPKFSHEHLEQKTISVALVNRARRDIMMASDRDETKRCRAFGWKKTALTNTLIENNQVNAEFKYDADAWTGEVQEAVQLAVENGAHVICLGEFDYPPKFSGSVDEAQFRAGLRAAINASKDPVILFAGSRHEREKTRIGGESEFHAHNIGHVFLNEALVGSQGPVEGVDELKIYKRTPASKVGEQLSRQFGIDILGYRTVLGRICFLICSDAYDPTIAMEFFYKSWDATNKPEITFVPSYNMSPKLADMCETLSLMTNSVVVLLDVCAETRGRRSKQHFTRIWNSGELGHLSNGLRLNSSVGLSQGGMIELWGLDWIKAREFQAARPVNSVLPLFHEARMMQQSGRAASA